MPAIKSLDDLKRIRAEALEKRKVKSASGNVQVTVAMGACGLAAGARETMKAILGQIEAENLNGISVSQTGCIGLCEHEPIVQVTVGEAVKVIYGKVTPEVARRIMDEHIRAGKVLQDYVLPI